MEAVIARPDHQPSVIGRTLARRRDQCRLTLALEDPELSSEFSSYKVGDSSSSQCASP